MSSVDPSQRQLTDACDAVAHVLDSYREKHRECSPIERPSILEEVKLLFSSLQKLEADEAFIDGAFYTADARARGNIHTVLDGCRDIAAKLRKRINSNDLSSDRMITREIISLSTDIDSFLKTYGKIAASPSEDDAGFTSKERTQFKDLEARSNQLLLERDALRAEVSIQHAEIQAVTSQNAKLSKDNEVLFNNDEAKLSHIRRLHAAIWNLGLRHSLRHTAIHWEQLTKELPGMIDRVNATNNKLKELEDELDEAQRGVVEDIASTPQPRRAAAAHARTKSEPKGKSSGTLSSSGDLVQRSPSPTESNISLPRDPPSRIKIKGKGVGKRRDYGFGASGWRY